MKKLFILFVLISFLGCNKAVVHGKNRSIPPINKSYSASVSETVQAAKKALNLTGYEVRKESRGLLLTEWRPTKATSHYTEVFKQKDYGTVGSYYYLRLKVQERDGKSEVQISAPVRSLVDNQKSSYREERKILTKIGDLLRQDTFKMTNLGVE